MREVTAYINAGGQGSRLHSLFKPDAENGLAKALLEVGTPPTTLVDHHIGKLLAAGVGKVVVGAAHQRCVADYVDQHYGDSDRVHVAKTERQLGTGAELMAAFDATPELFGDHIYVCNVDTILDIDEKDFLQSHRENQRALSIAFTRNVGVPNEGAFYIAQDNAVLYSAEAATNRISLEEADTRAVARGSSTGAVLIDKDYLASFPRVHTHEGEFSLYRQFLGAALLDGQVSGYDNGHKFFMDVGTVQTWNTAQQTGLLQEHLCARVDDTRHA